MTKPKDRHRHILRSRPDLVWQAFTRPGNYPALLVRHAFRVGLEGRFTNHLAPLREDHRRAHTTQIGAAPSF